MFTKLKDYQVRLEVNLRTIEKSLTYLRMTNLNKAQMEILMKAIEALRRIN